MKIRLNINIFLFLILFIFTNQLEIYTLMMLFSLLHELAHLICGLFLGFKPVTFKIMPLGFCIAFHTKIEEDANPLLKGNRAVIKKIMVSLAGPIFNLLVVIIGYIFQFSPIILYANLLIFLFNMIPIYPLDGGRIVKNILKLFLEKSKARKVSHHISNISIILLTMLASIAIYAFQNIAILLVIVVLWGMIWKENKKFDTLDKIYKVIDKSENYI